jgi:hypothetical protein
MEEDKGKMRRSPVSIACSRQCGNQKQLNKEVKKALIKTLAF